MLFLESSHFPVSTTRGWRERNGARRRWWKPLSWSNRGIPTHHWGGGDWGWAGLRLPLASSHIGKHTEHRVADLVSLKCFIKRQILGTIFHIKGYQRLNCFLWYAEFLKGLKEAEFNDFQQIHSGNLLTTHNCHANLTMVDKYLFWATCLVLGSVEKKENNFGYFCNKSQ